MPYIYYRKQCDYCTKREKCEYERKTRYVLDAIRDIERIASGVYGSYSFKCDYFDLDEVKYVKENPPECCGS